MLKAVIIFGLAAVWLSGVLVGIDHVKPTPILLPFAVGLVSLGAGFLGIIFAAQFRYIRELSTRRD